MPVILTFFNNRNLYSWCAAHIDSDLTFSRSCDQGEITKKGFKEYYRCLIDFLSQISKLFYFSLLDLADFLMHH